jgi:lysozyme family protein
MSLTQDTDFKCVDKAGNPLNFCFGIGAANHTLLQKLQQAVNRLANLGGFPALTVDGFIGPDTVAAVRKVLFIGPVGSLPWTKETISNNASEVIDGLNSIAADLQTRGDVLAPEGTPVEPTIQTMATSTGIPQESAADIIAAALGPAPSNQKTFKLLPWILGGLAVVAAVGVGGYFYHRHKARQQLGWGDDDDFGDDDLGNDDLGDDDLGDNDFDGGSEEL